MLTPIIVPRIISTILLINLIILITFGNEIPIIKFIHIFYPIKVFRQAENPEGRTVFVSNHLSIIDSVFMLELAKKDLFLLAKKELFKNKLLARILKSFGAISIDRENPDVKSIILATRLLKEDKIACTSGEDL